MTRKGGRVTADQVKTAGGPAQLIAQLVSDLVKGTHEERAAAALTLKCLTEQASIHDLKEGKRKENSELIAEAGAIPGLSEAIEIGGAGPHALAALANICLGSAKYQQQLLDADGVPRIAKGLRGGDPPTQTAAAAAAASLSQLVASRQPLVNVGAIVSLVPLLKGGHEAQVHAAQSLAELAKGFGTAGAHSIAALAQSKGDSLDAPRAKVQTAIAKAGATELLVSMLESGKAQEAASHALERLAEGNEEIQAEINAKGGIPRLVALLGVVNIDTQAHAAGALAAIASGDNTDEQVSSSGAMGPLIASKCI